MATTFMNFNFFFLVMLLALATTICLDICEEQWGCANFRGFCRKVCFPQEKSLGPQDCGEDFVCCTSGAME